MHVLSLLIPRQPRSTLFPYTTLFRSCPRMSIPRIAWAFARASSGSSASLIPPALPRPPVSTCALRSEEHTSELQSQSNLVCRLLLQKKQNVGAHARPASAPARRYHRV